MKHHNKVIAVIGAGHEKEVLEIMKKLGKDSPQEPI